ncbi:hypothetical protein GCM10022226_40930 [Sphaerisporangium flaviroseum]|uniref:Carrier domain-containing protein n=1 Tax=Sphaerisporangium flaviroseum TaxID=509199 RepID=A0ABP7IE07_9ACTN
MTVSPTTLTDAQRALLARMTAAPGERDGLFPATAAQSALWFLDQLTPGESAYHMPALLRLRGPLAQERLAGALQGAVDRHEALRTTFVGVGGRPLQRVARRSAHHLATVDATGRDLGEVLVEAAKEAHAPFDLKEGPLLRSVLWRLGEDDHLLLLVAHHIVADGWSVGVLLEELAADISDHRLPPYPVEQAQPVDLALREISSARNGALARNGGAVRFWVETLAGAGPSGLPERVDEPADRACGTVRLPLHRELAERVREFARERRTTDHAVYLSALAALCHRMTGRTDVVVGVPFARRDTPDTQRTVGFLVNTLPLRITWDGDPAFAELATITARALRDAMAHGEVPFDLIRERVTEARQGDRAPLFDIMLTVDPELLPGGRLGGLDVEPIPLQPRSAKFPLTLGIGYSAGEPFLTCEYDTGRFDAGLAQSLSSSLVTLLGAAISAPWTPLAEIALPAAAPQARLGHGPDLPDVLAGAGLGEAVAGVAATDPGRLALADQERRLTYGELMAEADRLAAVLRSECAGATLARRPVAVCLERGVDQAVACLAVVRAGGHYLALDPADPVERHWNLIAESDPCLLVTTSEILLALGPAGVRTISLDRLGPRTQDAYEPPPGWPGAPAAVIQPGGPVPGSACLLLTHEAVARPAAGARAAIDALPAGGASPGRVCLLTGAVSSSVALWELWTTLLTGSSGVILPPGALTPEAVGAAVREHGVTTALLTTRLFREIVHDDPEALEPLTELLIGGEALSARHVRAAGRSLGRTTLAGVYGPPEGPAVAVAGRAGGSARSGVPEASCGLPVAGVEVHVLDAALRPVPVEAVGEIYLGGPAIATGYLNRPALTAERFVPSPFGTGRRLFRTGDRGRSRADGTLVVTAAQDRRLEIGGRHVAASEVEARLATHPRVADVLLAVRDDERGESRLVAYVVPGGGEPRHHELRELASAHLPAAAVPDAFLTVERIPLDGDGRPDVDALPRPAPARESTEPEPPATDLERLVARAWADALGRDVRGISRSDDFFRLGGHSLLATRVVARLADELSRPVPVQVVFDHPTLAASAEALSDVGEGEAIPPVVPVRDRDRMPLSFAQQRLWFMHQYDPAGSQFNMPLAVRLRGDLDVEALHGALNLVVDRHETLRTTFEADGDVPRPRIRADHGLVVAVVDAEHRGVDADRVLRQAALAPFDLTGDLPIRAVLVRSAAAEHVLLVVVHHIACDGWSVGVLAAELSAAYAALRDGRTPALPELPVQYGDFSAWQRDRLSGEVLRAELEHWTRALAGAPPVLHLPGDHPRPPVFRHRGRTLPIGLGTGPGEAVRRIAAEHDLTPFMVLLTALAVVLRHCAGQEEVVVGTPVAGRPRPEVENLIGCFIDVLPLRVDVSGDPSVKELLARVRRVCVEAYAHQQVPFERLVAHLRPERDLSRTPVFQVMLALQSGPAPALDLDGVEAAPYPMDNGTAQHDLSLWLRDEPGRITGHVEFNRDVFEQDGVTRLVARLGTVLEWLADAGPGDPVSGVDVVPAAGLAAVGEAGTGAEAVVPGGSVADVLLDGRDFAVADGERLTEELSRDQVAEMARSIAGSLAARGVRRGDAVGVMLPRSPLVVPVLLGVWLAGAAYVPLDPEFPAKRLGFMIADSGARVVIGAAGLVDRVAGPGLDIVVLEELPASVAAPAVTVSGTDLAYVMYTSGSTGRPKGVMVPHAAVLNLLASMVAEPGLGPDDVLVAVTTLSFDISVLELFGPLLAGARLVVAGAAQAADPVLLAELVDACGATVTQATPATWRLLLESDRRPARPLRVWSGGEALPPEVAAGLLAAGHTVVNLYGPTETTIWSAAGEVGDPGRITLGRAVANTRLYVLDDRMRPVPAGAVGELHIGGAGVARGYLGRPGLTAERFVPSPFAADERLYRTGDLARFGSDGSLSFAGRADGQVKVRGHRIELGEVETRLAGHPEVAEAVVTVRDDRLVAYIVTGPTPPSLAELRDHLRDLLPEYMIPSALVVLDQIPRTLNGKTDRNALPAPPGLRPSAGRVAPRTPLEAVVLQVFGDVLGAGTDTISVLDDFFGLGGHSMLATRAAGRLSRILRRRVSLRQLFEHPTAAALAAELASATGQEHDRPPLVPAGGHEPAPLSFAQRRLWFLHRLEGSGATYNIPLALRLSGPLDRTALAAALDDVVARHESLRTVFPDVEGAVHQVVLDPGAAAVPMEIVDTTEEGLRARLDAASLHGFDLAREIPLRAWLFAAGPDEHVLLLVIHHIAGDEASLRPFLRDLAHAYLARRQGRAPRWSPLPVQYRDYAIWQRRALGVPGDPAGPLGGQLAYWREALRDLPAELRLPADHRRPAVATHRGDTVGFRLGAETLQELRDLARQSGVTPFMVVQAAVAALLTRLGAGTDIPLGTPVDARGHEALDDLIGLFLNTLVLRTDTSGDPTFRRLLARVRETDLVAQEHAELPFEQLVEALNPARSLSTHPLFQVVVAYQSAPPPVLDLPQPAVRVEEVRPVAAKFDLGFAFNEHPDGIEGNLVYALDLFDRETAVAIVDRLERLLRGAAADPDRPIGDIPVLSEDERRRLALDWNDTASEVPDECWPDSFEAQVARDPGRVAIVFEDRSLTYAELDAAANRLAHLLIERGAGPERLVALALPRSPELFVALIAVLKSGSGYLPLDTDNPAARIRFMLADARPVLLLATRETAPALPPDAPVILLDDPAVAASLAGRPGTAPTDADRARPLSTGNTAYVIYTSGSTGEPKGVIVTHAGVPSLVATAVERFQVNSGSRILQFASVGFDVAFWELSMALHTGARLVVVPADRRVSGAPLTGYIAEHGVTHLALPPSLLAVLPPGCDLPPDVTVLTGSETVPAEVVTRFSPGRRLLNAYGPTEATVNSTLWEATAGWDGDSVPIGRPDSNTRTFVLDPALRMVPPGVVGELFISGPGLARGYAGRPGATAAVFVPDPFGPPGSRMYRTGDLARWTAAGVLEFAGRTDAQVKIRGFRIEPGEIEAALVRHPDVLEAVVVPGATRAGGTRLIAYVGTGRAGEGAITGLRAHVAETLPGYMVPSMFVLLDELPRAANGKVDRERLPEPVAQADTVLDPPETDLERAVAAVVREVLEVPAIGLQDDLFELGGHSLQIPRIAARLAERTGVEIALRDVFLAPTVAGMVEAVDRTRGSTAAPITRVDRRERRRGPGRPRNGE